MKISKAESFPPIVLLQPDFKADQSFQAKNKVKTGFLVCALVYSVFSATVSAAAYPLVELMAQSEDLTDDTVAYIRLELVAIVASSLAKFLTSVMVVHEFNALLYLTLAAQMVASITLDYLLGEYLLLNSGNSVLYNHD